MIGTPRAFGHVGPALQLAALVLNILKGLRFMARCGSPRRVERMTGNAQSVIRRVSHEGQLWADPGLTSGAGSQTATAEMTTDGIGTVHFGPVPWLSTTLRMIASRMSRALASG